MDAKDQLIDDMKKRIRDLMSRQDTLEAAAQINHDAYAALQAENDLLRHELAAVQHELQTERQRPAEYPPDERLDLLADALRPFAESGRFIPADSRPKTFYVPGVHNATTFSLNALRLAADTWEMVFGWEKTRS